MAYTQAKNATYEIQNLGARDRDGGYAPGGVCASIGYLLLRAGQVLELRAGQLGGADAAQLPFLLRDLPRAPERAKASYHHVEITESQNAHVPASRCAFSFLSRRQGLDLACCIRLQAPARHT